MKKASKIIGGNPLKPRRESDFYPTPPEVTVALLDFLRLPKWTRIWEPACGQNHMVNVMKDLGYEVVATDIQIGTDFLTADCRDCDWIITNPPFGISDKFIERCIKHGKPFALLLKSQYWHAKKRLDLYRKHPPTFILPLTWRPDFLFTEPGDHKPLMDVCWVVWQGRPCAIYHPLERPEVRHGR